MEDKLLEWLNTGGNFGVFFLLYIMWRFDRRLVALESVINEILKEERSKRNDT